MPSSLRNRLNELAESFSAGVLGAIRGASLEEVLSESSGGKARTAGRTPLRSAAPVAAAASAPPRRKPGRLPRRSAGDISQAVEKVVGLLGAHPGGLRAEQIRQKLGLQAKELPRPLKEGLDAGRLSKTGRKRATTYFAGKGPRKSGKVAASAPRAGRPRAGAAKAGAAKSSGAKPSAKAGAKMRRRAKAAKA